MNQITLGTKEFYELLAFFEKIKPVRGRYDREKDKDYWRKGVYYEDGNVNEAFKMFLHGCNFGISLCR